jgi:arylsulfatase A-like enzyme
LLLLVLACAYAYADSERNGRRVICRSEGVTPLEQALAPEKTRVPNIIFILADDLGYSELGCQGNTFNETPRLDRLAAGGIRFTQAYAAAPVCSPYRASLMSGQWPARVGITDYLRPDDPKHLPLELLTLPEALKAGGYATGLIGKWHLTGYRNHAAEEFPPGAHGFDETIVSENRGIAGGSYFHPYHFNRELQPRQKNVADPRSGEPTEYLTDRLNVEAVEFIERHRDEPFFLFKSHYAVHTRLDGRPDLVAKYEARPGAGKGRQAPRNNPHLAAQLEVIDRGVGMIVDKLDELGLLKKTILIFTSDNGGEDRVTSNAPLRAGKSTLYEGGIREPLIVHWPGVAAPGTLCRAPVCSVDFFPTLLELAGVRPAECRQLDGVSLVPLLKDPAASLGRETLYWHYPLDKPHFLGGRSSAAIRDGDWKLIEFFDDRHVELYNLAEDLGEQNDLSKSKPELVERLRAKLKKWRFDAETSAKAPLEM